MEMVYSMLKKTVKTEMSSVWKSESLTHMVPDVVGTMGMSSASVGIDQGIWNWGASSLITMFLQTKKHNKNSH